MMLEAMMQRLEREMAKVAHETLQSPVPGDFNYGRAVGVYAGLEMAKRALLDLVAEKDRRDFDL